MTDSAVILAGGLGTRLRSITLDRWPKPMCPFEWRGQPHPFLEFPLAHLRRSGIERVVICIGHLGEQFRDHFGDGRRHGLQILYDDAGSAETATRVQRALALLAAEQVLVLCGDVYCPLDLPRFMASFDARPDRLLHAAVRPGHAAANLAWNREGLALAYADELAHAPAGAPANDIHLGREVGVLAVRRAAFDGHHIGDDLSLTSDIYPGLLARRALGIFEVDPDTPFFDIGTPAGHEQFRVFVDGGGAEPLHRGPPEPLPRTPRSP